MLGGGVHLIDVMMRVTGERPECVATVGSRMATRDTGVRGDDLAAPTCASRAG